MRALTRRLGRHCAAAAAVLAAALLAVLARVVQLLADIPDTGRPQ